MEEKGSGGMIKSYDFLSFFFFLWGCSGQFVNRSWGWKPEVKLKKKNLFFVSFLGIDAIRHEYKRNNRLFSFTCARGP
jgi:hypothetical protein